MRRSAPSRIKHSIYSVVALLLLVCVPAPYTFANGTNPAPAPDTSTCNPVAPAPTGIQRPTGADAGTYTYNACTGLWENQYYTWNPATQMATPKSAPTYSCDPTTWQWVTHAWIYAPSTGTFVSTAMVAATLPAGALVAADSLNPCAPAPVVPSTPTGPNGTTSGTATNTIDTTLNNTTNATMQNGVTVLSLSGDAGVLHNMLGGSATSGNATAVANVLNAVQTNTALTGTAPVTFVANLNGTVQGDLIINPGALQPATTAATLTNNSSLTVNNQTSGQIANTIHVGAQTGAAAVAGNTTAGSATSGNAAAVADVMNMLNSVVSAGQSFVGVINVNGNLNGNILMPQHFLDSLIASNAPSSTVTLDNAQAASLGITNTANLATTNTVHNTATTGAATVADNTTAGSATSGTAATNVRIFNLTGNQVVGANCLLVFVNVSGEWVGVIMSAPNGATAAALGSGVTANNTDTTAVNTSTNNAITNDITVGAASGAATVADNTTAGSARSGNANTAVNLLNMNTAQFSLTGWFGILFINVFGNWYGNFGVFTAPVTPAAAPAPTVTERPAPPQPPMFRFVSHDDEPTVAEVVHATTSIPTVGAVLAAKTTIPAPSNQALAHDAKASYSSQVIVGAALVIVGLGTLVGERLVSRYRVRAKAQV